MITLIFFASCCYIMKSKDYQVSYTTFSIYLLSITSAATGCVAWFMFSGSSVQLNLFAVSFITHWLSLGIFTSGYINVANQTPLFLDGSRKCRWLPFILNFSIVLSMCGIYYAFVFIQTDLIDLNLISLLLKITLASALLTI